MQPLLPRKLCVHAHVRPASPDPHQRLPARAARLLADLRQPLGDRAPRGQVPHLRAPPWRGVGVTSAGVALGPGPSQQGDAWRGPWPIWGICGVAVHRQAATGSLPHTRPPLALPHACLCAVLRPRQHPPGGGPPGLPLERRRAGARAEGLRHRAPPRPEAPVFWPLATGRAVFALHPAASAALLLCALRSLLTLPTNLPLP